LTGVSPENQGAAPYLAQTIERSALPSTSPSKDPKGDREKRTRSLPAVG